MIQYGFPIIEVYTNLILSGGFFKDFESQVYKKLTVSFLWFLESPNLKYPPM